MGNISREGKGDGPHPRQEPRIPLPLTEENVRKVFRNAADFGERKALLGGNENRPVTLFFIGGMVRGERVNDYLLRPLAQDRRLGEADAEEAYRLLKNGALYNLYIKVCTDMDAAAGALVDGSCLLMFPGERRALSFSTATEEKRSVSEPENESSAKGARDSFVESLRTNTSLVRRRLKAPELCLSEHFVGRQSLTAVDVLWLVGIADPELVKKIQARVDEIDIASLSGAGFLEQYVVDERHTAFPLTHFTERPDRFSAGLAEGRVGILADGMPVGWLLPATVDQFLATEQELSGGWVTAGVLLVLRYLCLFVSLLLPGIYIAAVLFHPEMLPAPLMKSIVSAKRDVPFGTVFEVLMLLGAFELLQEAGRYLPAAIGQMASILGGLVVGSAAVEARIISPAVLVTVAVAGVAGFTTPSQDFAGALRLWRVGLAVLAAAGGLPAVTLGLLALLLHLGRLETFDVPYLAPFASSVGTEDGRYEVLRLPLPAAKLRLAYLRVKNRRNQR